MSSLGKPRQPKETQENKDGTLRYEHETNTWQCTRCDKNYSIQNARSARSHSAARKSGKRNEKSRRKKPYSNTSIRIRTRWESKHSEAMDQNTETARTRRTQKKKTAQVEIKTERMKEKKEKETQSKQT